MGGTIASVLRVSAGAVLSATLASSPAPGRRISTGWPAAAAEQAAQPCPAASPPRALAPAQPHAAAAAAEATAAVAPRSAPRRDPGREVLLLKRAAPAALVERKPPEPKAPAPAQLAAPPWLGELSGERDYWGDTPRRQCRGSRRGQWENKRPGWQGAHWRNE